MRVQTPASLRAKRLIARCIAMALSLFRYAQLHCSHSRPTRLVADVIVGDVQLAQTLERRGDWSGEPYPLLASTAYVYMGRTHMQLDAAKPAKPCSRPAVRYTSITLTSTYSTSYTYYACSKYRATAPARAVYHSSSTELLHLVLLCFPSHSLSSNNTPPRAVCQAPGILVVTGIAASGPRETTQPISHPVAFPSLPSFSSPPGFDNLQLPSCCVQALLLLPAIGDEQNGPEYMYIPSEAQEHY